MHYDTVPMDAEIGDTFILEGALYQVELFTGKYHMSCTCCAFKHQPQCNDAPACPGNVMFVKKPMVMAPATPDGADHAL